MLFFNDKLKKLSQFCANKGFYKRGNAFFRKHGDGVLQVIKYRKSTYPWKQEYISIGIFSLYGELMPQWLTSAGCIPRYEPRWLDPEVRKKTIEASASNHYTQDDIDVIFNWELDLAFVERVVLPYLDSVDTQKKAVEAIMFLDAEASGAYRTPVLWNDILKFAPFLYSGDYENAEKVIQSILDQHAHAFESNAKHFTPEQFAAYMERNRPGEESLENLKQLVKSRDVSAIEAYLRNNYENNIKLAKFLR